LLRLRWYGLDLTTALHYAARGVCVTSSVHREGGLLALQSLLPANEELFYAFHENLSQRIPTEYKDMLVKATDLLADPMVPRKSRTRVAHNTHSLTSHVTPHVLHVKTPSVDMWGRGINIQAKVKKTAVQVMASVIPWLEERDQRDTAARRLVSLMLHDPNLRKAACVRLGKIDKLAVLQACMEHHQLMLDALGSTSLSSVR
jgi:hypothetical protein